MTDHMKNAQQEMFNKHASKTAIWEGPTHLCWICIHETVCIDLFHLQQLMLNHSTDKLKAYPIVDICNNFKEK
jgi:hypothetical protein